MNEIKCMANKKCLIIKKEKQIGSGLHNMPI